VYSKLQCFNCFLAVLTLGVASVATVQAQTPAAPAATSNGTTAIAAPATSVTTATLRGHIADPTGARIPGATITVTTPAGKTATTATADANGHYQVAGLAPGSYILRASFAGFADFVSQTLPLTASQVMRVDISMAMQVAQQSVVVTDESPTVSVEAGGNASSFTIKGKDLDALSDDPDELSNELSALAGPSAGPNGGQIYIDGFTGGDLPPKSAIREIRINQNPYSAEFDRLGYGRIEILTKPGTDKLHGQAFAMGNDKSFNTGNPFTQNIPDYHSYQFNGTLNGSLSKNASFFISAERRNTQNADVYKAETAEDVYQDGALLNPHTRTNASARFDLQLGQKNTLTARYQIYHNTDNNDLDSTLDLPTQATSSSSTNHSVQLSDALIINDRIVNETRFQYRHESSSETPANTAPVVSVSSYFTGGGSSSQASKDSSDSYELQNLTTMSLGAHALKFGTRLRDGRDDNTTNAGFNGSFSFTGLDAYNKAVAALGSDSFVSGDSLPTDALPQKLDYTTGQLGATANVFDAAVFVQDDWKANKMLTVSGGLRWESQNHVSDHSDWAPRVAIAYALDGHKTGKSKTVLRAGYGLFYDRFSLSNELNLIRNGGNANSQTQHTITNPSCFANTYLAGLKSADLASCVSSASTVPTSTIVNVASNYHSPYTQQFGVGLERQLTKGTTVTATYLHSFGVHQMVTIDANAYKPGDFVFGSATQVNRPEGAGTGIVDEYLPEAVFKQDQLILNVNTKLTSNLTLMGFYNYTDAHANTGTAPNSYDLKQGYGRAGFAPSNMLFMMASYQAPWGIRFNPFLIAEGGKPYNIVTNNDLSGDNFYNNRPSVVDASNCTATSNATSLQYVKTSYGCLNTQPKSGDALIPVNMATSPSSVTMMLRVSRTFGVGPKTASGNGQNAGGPPPGGPPPGGGGGHGGGPGGGGPGGFGPGGFGGNGGRPPRGMFDSSSSRKYNLTFSVQAQNVFNNINYGAPSGTILPTYDSVSKEVNPGNRFGKANSLAGGPFSSNAAARRIFFQATFAF
jgi:hypothetical protein